MKLSLCIATYNEEKFIHYPLDSCIDWVDEVIVVDGGSTDKTVQIAKSYGKKVKVFVVDNPPMFHINKQKAIEMAKGDWILQLDADEEVPELLREEILSIVNSKSEARNSKQISNNENTNVPKISDLENSDLFLASDLGLRASQHVAYWLPRKNFFLGRFLTKGGVYPDKTIRLYKNGAATFPCKTVHENVEINGPIGELKKDLLHYADPEFSRYLKRWHRYNDLDVKLLKENNKKVGVFEYIVLKPLFTFLSMYGRHKGFMDGWQGFVFAFFSSIRYIDIYMKSKEQSEKSKVANQN